MWSISRGGKLNRNLTSARLPETEGGLVRAAPNLRREHRLGVIVSRIGERRTLRLELEAGGKHLRLDYLRINLVQASHCGGVRTARRDVVMTMKTPPGFSALKTAVSNCAAVSGPKEA
jgi:hypothetical protein